jgi:hypothetical protein
MRDNGWVKSSYSGGATDNCVEVRWLKSSHSAGASDNCVEVSLSDHCVGVRDSKNPDGGVLHLPPSSWVTLLQGDLRPS